MQPTDARLAKDDERESESDRRQVAKDKADEIKVLNAVDALDPERNGVTYTKIRTESKLSTDRSRMACNRLVAAEILDSAVKDVKSNNGAKIKGECFWRKAVV